jgi:hypothetical protein
MITKNEKLTVDIIRKQLLGVKLSNSVNGEAGRDLEDKLEYIVGIPINRKEGVDCIDIDWEVKSRHVTATSAQTIGTMLPEDVISTVDYFDTPIYKKFRKQLRVSLSENSVILDIDLFDFDDEYIQGKFAEAYSNARNYILQYPTCTYTPCTGQWAYFENTNPNKTKSLDWRVRDAMMKQVQTMTKSTFTNIFDYA